MARHRWRLGWVCLGLGLFYGSGCGVEKTPPVSKPSGPAPVVVVDPQTPDPSRAEVTALQPAQAAVKAPTLKISPTTVNLAPGDPGFQLIAWREPAPGLRHDVTAEATWQVEPEGVLSVDRSGYVRPVGSGKASVVASHEGERASTAFTVESAAGASEPAWSFAEDIVPILTRAGCNTGSCHGRADGQNGFHLSFLGYDPEGDHRAITRDAASRRIDRMRPEASLILGKATGQIPHGGGLRFRSDSSEGRTLLAWLRAGAPATRGKTHGALVKLTIEPAGVRLDEPGPQQVRVVARYADGHERDVTRLASFRLNDDATLAIDPEGHARVLRRGEADLVVRYQSMVASTRLATIVNPDLEFDFARLKRRNFIDEELFKRLASLNVPPSPEAPDAAFLRRVSLDLTGQQPQPEQVRQFLADSDPEKRVKLVDRLIASPDFVLFWRIKLGDLLQITSTRFGNGSAYYNTWLKERLEENTPWDQAVKTLLTALGNPMVYGGGPVNYALDGPDAKSQAEQTAQRFLALRLKCAQCHDHPFDVWTQDDYFGLAAFFAKTQRSAGAMGGRTEVKLNPKGEVEHPRTHKPAVPKLLGGAIVKVDENDDPRKALAEWLIATDNPFFARATANWVWAQFFGKGIADPPDDLSRSNPPVHAELLDALAVHFIAHKFDLRDLIRTVAVSEAYGLSSGTITGNENDNRLFSHQIPRPLTAHQMADAIAQATDVPNRFPNKSAGARAIDVYDPTTVSPILDTFGRCPRTVACAAVSTPQLSLRQSLLLIGGDVIESKVTSLNGYLSNLLELGPAADEIVENLYMRVLCRPATAEEVSRWSADLKGAKSLREASEDLFWALLNSREFSFNH